jgi:hypothetical protein
MVDNREKKNRAKWADLGVSGPQEGDIRTLRDCREWRARIGRAETRLVGEMREAGHSWADIGGHLGMSAQAAHKRFARVKPS